MNNLPHRKNIRLNCYNYSNVGMYFVTICTQNRKEILGKIKDIKINLTKEGLVSEKHIKNISFYYNNIIIDEYIIMPNHIHMIIEISSKNDITLSRIIKHFKESVTKTIGYGIWQKSFYEHIIRNEKEYIEIKKYIQNNIINWTYDKYF